jgi:hypothetical protein
MATNSSIIGICRIDIYHVISNTMQVVVIMYGYEIRYWLSVGHKYMVLRRQGHCQIQCQTPKIVKIQYVVYYIYRL